MHREAVKSSRRRLCSLQESRSLCGLIIGLAACKTLAKAASSQNGSWIAARGALLLQNPATRSPYICQRRRRRRLIDRRVALPATQLWAREALRAKRVDAFGSESFSGPQLCCGQGDASIDQSSTSATLADIRASSCWILKKQSAASSYPAAVLARGSLC